jgi:hypothetical protein
MICHSASGIAFGNTVGREFVLICSVSDWAKIRVVMSECGNLARCGHTVRFLSAWGRFLFLFLLRVSTPFFSFPASMISLDLLYSSLRLFMMRT